MLGCWPYFVGFIASFVPFLIGIITSCSLAGIIIGLFILAFVAFVVAFVTLYFAIALLEDIGFGLSTVALVRLRMVPMPASSSVASIYLDCWPEYCFVMASSFVTASYPFSACFATIAYIVVAFAA